jgi:3-oxoacyl-[acyl-carrier protein] reductase
VETNPVHKVALIDGAGNSLGRAIALELARAGYRLALSDAEHRLARFGSLEAFREQDAEPLLVPWREGEEPARRTWEVFGRLDCVVHLLVPLPEMGPEELYARPMRVLASGLASAELLSGAPEPGVILTHCPLPAAYLGTKFEDCLPAVRGAMTGVTRSLCRRLGARGISANCIQTGLMEMPEARELESERVRPVKAPVGRRGTPEDMARLATFMIRKNRYITGQAVLLDGGQTSGITGT